MDNDVRKLLEEYNTEFVKFRRDVEDALENIDLDNLTPRVRSFITENGTAKAGFETGSVSDGAYARMFAEFKNAQEKSLAEFKAEVASTYATAEMLSQYETSTNQAIASIQTTASENGAGIQTLTEWKNSFYGENGEYQNVKVDVIFPVLHGKNGEDGTIQGLFQLAEIPFVGCDCISSANCMDKGLTHTVLDANGIKTAKWVGIITSELSHLDKKCDEMESKLGYPMFVKPANCGSSVGVSKAKNRDELKSAIKLAFAHDSKVIVEETIVGMECECAVMGNDEPFASTVGEVCSANDEFYDFDAKYNDAASKTLIPARMSEESIEEIRKTAVKAYRAMGCSGLSRVDFFLMKDGTVILNEINTLPGHTPISMYPQLMQYEGMTPAQQEDKLIKLALDKAEVDYE